MRTSHKMLAIQDSSRPSRYAHFIMLSTDPPPTYGITIQSTFSLVTKEQ